MADDDRQERTRLKAEIVRLWSDPAMKQILGMVRAEIRKESETSKPEEKELREHCYYLLNAVVRIEDRLKAFATGGSLDLVRQTRGGDRSAS